MVDKHVKHLSGEYINEDGEDVHSLILKDMLISQSEKIENHQDEQKLPMVGLETNTGFNINSLGSSLYRRFINNREIENKTCILHLKVDHNLYKEILGDLSGGLCSEVIRLMYKGEMLRGSVNTGVITMREPKLQRGHRVPARKSQLVLAHEFGHSLGAQHDEVADDWEDERLMAPGVGIYESENTTKFSRQSVAQISAVLDALESYEPYDPSGKTVHRIKKNCLQ